MSAGCPRDVPGMSRDVPGMSRARPGTPRGRPEDVLGRAKDVPGTSLDAPEHEKVGLGTSNVVLQNSLALGIKRNTQGISLVPTELLALSVIVFPCMCEPSRGLSGPISQCSSFHF